MATGRLSPRVRSSNETTLFGVDLSRGIFSAVGQAKDYVGGILDPSKKRMANAGLSKGAEQQEKQSTTARFADSDWRVRLSLPDNGLLYHDETNTVLHPLVGTNGLIFPYTPQILLQHTSNYTGVNPTHSNYTQHFYSNSSIDAISIQCDFTAQNQREATYVLAAITFLRSVTKMFWGKDDIAGTPPPVLRLNGYGDYIFNNIPVVVSNFTVDLNGQVDYMNTNVTTKGAGGTRQVEKFDEDGASWFEEENIPSTLTSTRVPTKTSINVTLYPLYSRQRMAEFGLKDFSAGRLIESGKKTGGFI